MRPTGDGRKLLGLDPVCGMKVFEKPNAISREHGGTTYFFCNPRCAERFDADPEGILAAPGGHGMHRPPTPAAHADAPPVTETAGYVCPMCPEVHEAAPGACPSCGMALEPRTVAAEEAPNPELADMTRRFRLSAALALPLLLIAMGEMAPSLRHALGASWMPWLQLALAAPVVLWGGAPFFARGWRSIVTWRLNMFTLIAIGTGTAFVYSRGGDGRSRDLPRVVPDARRASRCTSRRRR